MFHDVLADKIKWPFATMGVGESFTVYKANKGYNTVRQYAWTRGKALGRKFSCKASIYGIEVTRTE